MLNPILRKSGSIHTQSGSIQRKTRISLAIRDTTTYSFVLLSVRVEPNVMGRQFVERRAEQPQKRITGRPVMGVQRSQNAGFHSNEPIHFLLQR